MSFSLTQDFAQIPASPLTLSHQLLLLAEQADRAGLTSSANALVKLACRVCGDRAKR